MPHTLKPHNIPCPHNGCSKYFTNRGGLTNHLRIYQAELAAQKRLKQLEKQRRAHVACMVELEDLVDEDWDDLNPFQNLGNPFDTPELPDIHDWPERDQQMRPEASRRSFEAITYHPKLSSSYFLSHKCWK